MCKGEKITFLDTPGHEAFAEMRARGAKVTDIAILVVAADDGIMPQTVEAIKHAKNAKVPIIVAINKIDKPAANPDKIKQALTEYELVTEEWGGDTMMVPLSAKTGDGIDKLLESILLLAEVNDYKANPQRRAKCSVIEAKLDKGKGPVANIIIQNGTLKVGDTVVSGITSGRIRAMTDDKGRSIKEAGPSMPVSVLGFTDVPNAGDSMMVVQDEKMAKQVVSERMTKIKIDQVAQAKTTTLDDVFNKISEGQIKDLNIIVKADVQGSVEALRNSLAKIVNEEARVNIISGGVGAINKSDIMLAEVSKAIVIGFNVRPDAETKVLAENSGIDIKLYKIIYEAIEDIQAILKGMLAPKTKEVITGKAQVRNVFKITGAGIIAGSYVQSGKIFRNSKARVYRDGEVWYLKDKLRA
ncbi:translation initiation factor if-2-related [Holotrichia oblita]|nr:translation initiation factor if-2-related [Holotrichia oblita]